MIHRTSVRGLAVPMVYLGTILGLGSAGAWAQEAAAPAEPTNTNATAGAELEEVVVTGYRAALQSALSLKRDAAIMVDAINAEDIADFPDANLAESLQRLPGIAIDRDNGEGRKITVRGLGSDFTRVRINGLEALATTARARFRRSAQPQPRFRLQHLRLGSVQLPAGAQDRIREHR